MLTYCLRYVEMTRQYGTLLTAVRRPEYTGANRCLPCTAVNLLLATGVAAAAAFVSRPLGAAVATASLAAIYFRGYLVPGTPELTKRYLPERVLALFGKTPGSRGIAPRPSGEVDPETYLLDADVLVETPAGDDFAFAPDFAGAWRAAVTSKPRDTGVDGDRSHRDDVAALATLTGIDAGELAIDWYEGVGFAYAGDEKIGHWESRAAFRADVAADRVLTATRGDWTTLALADRSAVLGALRLFVDECPSCAGEVGLEERVVESCCSSYDVVAGRCAGCDARLFELRLPESVAAAAE